MSSIEKAVERLAKGAAGGKSREVTSEPRIRNDVFTARDSAAETKCRLDIKRLEAHGYLTPESAKKHIAEEYRMLKRPLLMNAFEKGAAPVERGNLIMVTSALPGEGKTFTTMNLAMSMAMERDSTVLVIDSDVIKPSLSQLLGLGNEPGLIDVLLDPKMDLGDVIINTDMPKLRVLPAGRHHAHSTELLASEHMGRVADELSGRYSDRIVLFDAPPLLATSQANVLAHLVGQVLMVVEAGKTPQQAIKDAISQVDPSKVIGMALNKGRGTIRGDYYGGYYGSYGR